MYVPYRAQNNFKKIYETYIHGTVVLKALFDPTYFIIKRYLKDAQDGDVLGYPLKNKPYFYIIPP